MKICCREAISRSKDSCRPRSFLPLHSVAMEDCGDHRRYTLTFVEVVGLASSLFCLIKDELLEAKKIV